jgi:hypothetical protein
VDQDTRIPWTFLSLFTVCTTESETIGDTSGIVALLGVELIGLGDIVRIEACTLALTIGAATDFSGFSRIDCHSHLTIGQLYLILTMRGTIIFTPVALVEHDGIFTW